MPDTAPEGAASAAESSETIPSPNASGTATVATSGIGPTGTGTGTTASSSADDNKVRKDLVQVFFGLVLTQIAIYASALIQIWDQRQTDEYWAAWTHLVLSFMLTTTSWFGWQNSMRTAKMDTEASIFQGA